MLEISPIEIEQLSLNAWPSIHTYLKDGLIVRWADGYTKRANSATVLFDATWSADKQRWVERFYEKRALPPIFRLLSFNESDFFDTQLESAGYKQIDLTNVMTLLLDPPRAKTKMDHRCHILPLTEWLEIFHKLDLSKLGDKKKQLHYAILERVPGKLCPLVLTIDQEPVACGLGVLDGQGLGLFDIVTGELHRRKGYGSSLLNALLSWGVSEGATFSFLQVIAQNESAINLYVKKGFKITYSYWYRTKAR